MQLKIDDIELNDSKVRQIFPSAKMMKLSRSKVVWTNNDLKVAELELINGKDLLFKFGNENKNRL